jgi:putative ABC transport system permease protein
LNQYIFHIDLYDLVFLGAIFIGLNFSLLLWFTKRTNRSANRFLGLALFIIVLWMISILGIDIGLGTYFPHWSRVPLQFSLALGPLIFFYVLKITRPEYKFNPKDLLHFGPLLLELGAQLASQQLNSILPWLAFISIIVYLYRSHQLIESFYRGLKFNEVSDRYRNELRWLHRLLTAFGLLWVLWIPYTLADYFYYHHQLGIHTYYPLYLLLMVMVIWMAAKVHLRSVAIYGLRFLRFLNHYCPQS